MKTTVQLLVFFFCAVSVCAQPDNTISISHAWKFFQGDDAAFAKLVFPDAAWKEIRVDRIWEEQGYDPYDGYAWFRMHVFIPSTIIANSYLKDSLRIFLGKINNYDQTFVNGFLIGINGNNYIHGQFTDDSFTKAPVILWDKERRYTLAADDPRILWDAVNVIAVRVFDQGGQGGMYTGNQEVSMTNIREYFRLVTDRENFAFVGDNLTKTIRTTNGSSSLTITGRLIVTAVNKVTRVEVFYADQELTLLPLTSQDFLIEIPVQDESAVVSYEFDFYGAEEIEIFAEETPYVLTPLPALKPRINGAQITGARPEHPFLYQITATGKKPLRYEARKLPKGLLLDPLTGIITGKVKKPGDYPVMITVSNSEGNDQRELLIRIGEQLALTPPMGWNSWNCWGLSVDTDKIIASARAFVDKGLKDHGWTYINMDDGWEIPKDREPKRDAGGNILTNEKFPDMKSLGDSIHAMGLKFGIYSSPGPLTCGAYTGSYLHEINDAQSYAAWGIDYLKYDWCSYDNIAKDTSLAERKKPYFIMRDALDQVDRDIVYSLCQYGMSNVWEWGAEVGGNLWRTTGDITDTWESMREIGFSQTRNAPFAGPGHWNDPDMLVVGWVGWGPSLHPTRLTPDEQYTHISLWSLLSAPLLIGCDLTRLDPFTLNLLTNDEVLAINQDPLGRQATRAIDDHTVQVWIKDLDDGSKAIGIFALHEMNQEYNLDLRKLGFTGNERVRDLWRQKEVTITDGVYSSIIPGHGVRLVRVMGN
ncbi:MAG: alpha-galactosidase [Bacteroidetes bacterium]|nr:alpha-galactosidase [Bacteroidota bacterium]